MRAARAFLRHSLFRVHVGCDNRWSSKDYRMGDIETAIQGLRRKSIAEPEGVPVPTPEQIRDAEHKLGIQFPPSFLRFLREAGDCQLPFWQTYWVGGASLGCRNIVLANKEERTTDTPLPRFLVAFHNNGCGDQLCFDTRERSPDGEYPIVFRDHEATVEENLADLYVVADDFAEWLQQEVDAAELPKS
jgi:hypothetical protein